MRIAIATDHGAFHLKEELVAHLREAGHEIIDVGAHSLSTVIRKYYINHETRYAKDNAY